MKKTFKILTVFALTAALLMGGAVSASAANGKTISKAKAKQVALNRAKVKKSSVKKWTKVKLDNWDDDHDREWEVEFRTGTYKYEVEINARTGRVEDFEKERLPKASAKKLTKTQAKNKALKAVGVKKSAVKKWIKIRLDGKEWEIKFTTAKYEYDVEIDVFSGRVKDLDRELIYSESSKYIGVDKAKSIALAHAKKYEDISGSVRYKKVKLDHDDGRYCYEIEFLCGGMEFEYEIDAKTGSIVDWDMDYDD